MTSETPTQADHSHNSTDYMQWLEYFFYIALIAGVVFIAYQVMTNRWQLLERQPVAESMAQENV